MTQIQFFVPGIPAPGGSKKAFVSKSGRAVIVDDCKRNKPWRDRVISSAIEAYSGPPLDGPLVVTMAFVMPRPKYHYGTGTKSAALKPRAPRCHEVKPDVLKLARSTEDALTGYLWRDDSQTCRLLLEKFYGTSPGVKITVARMENP